MGPLDNGGLRLLAFDTSTETLSIAVQAGAGAPVLVRTAAGGAQASATLLPLVLQLLAEAGVALRELDAIAFGRGPGSFTGLRTACAVAQGLGFGAGVAVLPIDTLLAVAEEARAVAGVTRVVAVLDARMDEVYCAAYACEAGKWQAQSQPRLARPEDVPVPPGWALAGNALGPYAARLPHSAGARVEVLPTAAALLRLAPAALAAGASHAAIDALPLYVRDKVAQTTEERAAAKARPAASATLREAAP